MILSLKVRKLKSFKVESLCDIKFYEYHPIFAKYFKAPFL